MPNFYMIGPPSPFSPAPEWEAFLREMETPPQDNEHVAAAVTEARAMLSERAAEFAIRRRCDCRLTELAERKYPWRVDIEVRPGGLGPRLNAMMDWCISARSIGRNTARRSTCEVKFQQDFARFYFPDRG